jgi:transcriptional regulator with XRE-family HTH domain
MAEIAHSIDLNLSENLQDREYRQKFFLAESSAQIAAQLIALRKRRDLNQAQLADLIDTQQPAISRIEKADYQSWSFSVLRKIADALDARIRVYIQPSEDILGEYRDNKNEPDAIARHIESFKDIFRHSQFAASKSSSISGHLLAPVEGASKSAMAQQPDLDLDDLLKAKILPAAQQQQPFRLLAENMGGVIGLWK